MFRRLFILAAVVSLGLPAVRAQEGAASHAAVIQADTLPALLERLERDPEDIDLLVEICSQYTMRSEFAAIHPYVSRLRRAGAAHDDERALMYADLFSGQSYLLAEGSDSTRIYLDRALIRGRQCEDPVALCRIYNALGIYAVSIETNYFGGIEYFLEAMEYARSASLNRFYLVAQCNLANTYYMRNDPAGLKYAEEVCRLGTEWGYDYLAFGGAVISAYMHYMLGDQDRALEYILRTLPDTDKFGYHTELYSLYANILHAQGDDAGAERYYLMALDHIDEKVVTAIRKFVDEGGGFIGVGEPTACQHQGRYFQLSDVMGVDREMGFSLSTDKYNTCDPHHFILEDESFTGKIDFGEGTSRIYAQGKHYQILAQDGEYSQLVVNEYGKGHSVYFAGLPYSPQNCRILLRAIYYAAGMPEEMKHYYVTNVDTEVTVFPETKRIAVINNSESEQKTDLYIKGKLISELTLAPREMRWVDDAE